MEVRDKSIDIIKGVAIFLVLWGHCIQCIAGDEGFFSNWMIKFIYSFHMPLFMIISGYLFFQSSYRSILNILKNRLISLGVPFVVWNFLLYMRKIAYDYMTKHVVSFTFSDVLTSLVSGLWFLSSLFIITIVTSIIVKAFKRYKYVVCLMVWGGLILFSSLVGNHTADLFPFFVLGFAIAEHKNFLERCNKYRIVVYVLFAVLLMGIKESCFVYISGINPLTSQYGFVEQVWLDFYRLLTGVAGSLSIMLLIRRTYQRWAKPIQLFLSCLGQKTLQIYVLQSFLLEGVLSQSTKYLSANGGDWQNNLFILNFLVTPIVATVYACIFLIGIRIIDLIPGISLFLFGRKRCV